ncbi:unnamed protein product [Discosporangium mesarthrocarpum]
MQFSRTFISPVYLRSADGRRLLTYMIGIHPSLAREVHGVIKSQVPGAKKAVLRAYGEVYYRAWRAAEGPYLEQLEKNCIQAQCITVYH